MRDGGAQRARAIFASPLPFPALRADAGASIGTMQPRIITLTAAGMVPPLLEIVLPDLQRCEIYGTPAVIVEWALSEND
jgi:hypothetical protein